MTKNAVPRRDFQCREECCISSKLSLSPLPSLTGVEEDDQEAPSRHERGGREGEESAKESLFYESELEIETEPSSSSP